jgi:hypothetical protein
VWLAPTRLAQALASGGAGEAAGEVSDGFIVVETNYRVRPGARLLVPPDHACRLHCGIMSLFCACGLARTLDEGHTRWQMYWQARWRLPHLCSFPRPAPAHTRPHPLAPARARPRSPTSSAAWLPAMPQAQQSPRPAPRVAQVYAYTSSALQAAILRLFVRCECVLPNLFVGVLTRESVTGALGCGLAADQIVDFLRKHAHPHVAQRVPVVPEARPCCGRSGAGRAPDAGSAVWTVCSSRMSPACALAACAPAPDGAHCTAHNAPPLLHFTRKRPASSRMCARCTPVHSETGRP